MTDIQLAEHTKKPIFFNFENDRKQEADKVRKIAIIFNLKNKICAICHVENSKCKIFLNNKKIQKSQKKFPEISNFLDRINTKIMLKSKKSDIKK